MTDNRTNEPNKYAGFIARQNHQRDPWRGTGKKCLCGVVFDSDVDHAIHQAEAILEAALEAATRVPVQGEPSDDREALATLLDDIHGPLVTEGGCNFHGWVPGYMTGSTVSEDVDAILAAGFSRAAVPDAATELAEIKARAEEVDEDEGWHIGGAWGDYGEVVVPLRILSYVVDGALDEKIVSTDPGYAATYAEQIARADRAEAECDAALAAIERCRKLHHKITRYGNEDYSIDAEQFKEDPESYPDLRAFDLCAECYAIEKEICEECGGDCGIGLRASWPCPTVVALDGAPEPEWEYSVGFNDPECGWINDHADIHDCYEDARSDYSEPNWLVEDRVVRRRKAGPWLPVEGESK